MDKQQKDVKRKTKWFTSKKMILKGDEKPSTISFSIIFSEPKSFKEFMRACKDNGMGILQVIFKGGSNR